MFKPTSTAVGGKTPQQMCCRQAEADPPKKKILNISKLFVSVSLFWRGERETAVGLDASYCIFVFTRIQTKLRSEAESPDVSPDLQVNQKSGFSLRLL